jgi:hypothetical protein
MCESLCRQAYGLPAHYSSANLHADAIPSGFRHGHETPRAGDLVLYRNATHGHIVVATGNGWECYTNDYGGRGKVTKTDARNLVSWCGASSWFVADAWWSSSSYVRTHGEEADMPLTDQDLDNIARRVWKFVDTANTEYNMGWYQRNADARITSVDDAVWKVPSRTLTSGAPGTPGLTDADVDRIAQKVADVIYGRLRA